MDLHSGNYIRLHSVTWGAHGYKMVHSSGLDKATQSYMGVYNVT